jgi:hypothetical protein
VDGSESANIPSPVESLLTRDRACYADGVLVPAKPGATEDPKPAAANDGTVISVRLCAITSVQSR